MENTEKEMGLATIHREAELGPKPPARAATLRSALENRDPCERTRGSCCGMSRLKGLLSPKGPPDLQSKGI